MVHVGLDLSRLRVDVCALDDAGALLTRTTASPDAEGLRVLADRLAPLGEVSAVVESMTGARFVRDELVACGWEVLIADAVKVKGLAPLACKTDKIDAQVLAELSRRHDFLAIVPTSALRKDNVEDLKQTIARQLPLAPAMFLDGEVTDRGLEFRIAELIREKLTLELNQEVPYGIAVEVENMTEQDGQLAVDAAIWVDREGQKPIVIGARGERLKRVGRSARLALNGMLGRRLHLNLWVKVRENWADNARALKALGLE